MSCSSCVFREPKKTSEDFTPPPTLSSAARPFHALRRAQFLCLCRLKLQEESVLLLACEVPRFILHPAMLCD